VGARGREQHARVCSNPCSRRSTLRQKGPSPATRPRSASAARAVSCSSNHGAESATQRSVTAGMLASAPRAPVSVGSRWLPATSRWCCGCSATRSSGGCRTSAISLSTTSRTTCSSSAGCAEASGRCGTPRRTAALRSWRSIRSSSLSIWLFGARGALGLGLVLHTYLGLLGGSLLARRLGLSLTRRLAGRRLVRALGLRVVDRQPAVRCSRRARWRRGCSGRSSACCNGRAHGAPPPRGAGRAAIADARGRDRAADPRSRVSCSRRSWLWFCDAGARSAWRDCWRRCWRRPPCSASTRSRATRSAAWASRASRALGYSASPMVLVESLLPHLFGDVHSFSDPAIGGTVLSRGLPYLISCILDRCASGSPSRRTVRACGCWRPPACC
jgi:hypothetical protein